MRDHRTAEIPDNRLLNHHFGCTSQETGHLVPATGQDVDVSGEVHPDEIAAGVEVDAMAQVATIFQCGLAPQRVQIQLGPIGEVIWVGHFHPELPLGYIRHRLVVGQVNVLHGGLGAATVFDEGAIFIE
jgi:hypothetical protein